ncbi:MAG: hypothetical protein H8E21_02945 [Gammaproteobacteria bacterium]|nr:hypothetical protein [Gammaproteobacteria bacterium]MBL6999405.1 hypothetical protein [Gammaproteobacteria bacterium]
MSVSRKTCSLNKIIWLSTLLLSVVLLCGQNAKLHLHNFDHVHSASTAHDSVAELTQHTHRGEAHLALDSSHADHHAGMVTEINTEQLGLLQNVFIQLLTLALLIGLIALLRPAFYPLTTSLCRPEPPAIPWRRHFSPPLRAPPL